MKILALQGSPRVQGNTQTVLDMVLAGAKEAGAKVELVQLIRLKNLRGCLECCECQNDKNSPACPVKDDLQKVVEKALKADLLLLATPVFCWSLAWPLKAALDRFFCTFKFSAVGKFKSLLEGRKCAAVITAGGGKESGADLVTEVFKRTAKFSRMKWRGAFVMSTAESPSQLLADKRLAQKARAFGKKLSQG
jgi:multimeric flavodoxin WrbA